MVVGLGDPCIALLVCFRTRDMHLAAFSDANESVYSPANMRKSDVARTFFHIIAVAQRGEIPTDVWAQIKRLKARLGAMERSPGLIAPRK